MCSKHLVQYLQYILIAQEIVAVLTFKHFMKHKEKCMASVFRDHIV